MTWREQRVLVSRRRSIRQMRTSPGQPSSRRAGRIERTAMKRVSMRLCAFSTVAARRRSGGSTRPSGVPGRAARREGGIVAEGVGEFGFELGLVGFDEEEVV